MKSLLWIPITMGVFFLMPAHAAKSVDIEALRHMVDNQESELRMFENKLDSLNSLLESLNDQFSEAHAHQKALVKGTGSALDTKIASLESFTKSMAADIKKLHAHANDTSASLDFFKKKLSDWDQTLKHQNQNIENLQSAMQTLMEVLQVKADAGPSSAGKTYKVKDGDSLGKIAKSQGTTIQAIKEANNLNSDNIVVGKTLKIP
jgi:LysM repeat protein